MNLKKLLRILADLNCRKVYVKSLSPNDNSKNQVYLGGNFEVLNILPIGEIVASNDDSSKKQIFKTSLIFNWIDDEGTLINAPFAQLILYPQYPEVRFSGFLKQSKGDHNELMRSRIDKRLLFFGISDSGSVIGYVTAPDSELYKEFKNLNNLRQAGVFSEINIKNGVLELNSKEKLLSELKRIHELRWINSKRLDKYSNILPCTSSNCGGYTLEAELGITPNGFSDPDYLGWEIKQFSVNDFAKYNSSVITLMTPEPTHGFYTDSGIEAFIRKYGYPDKKGREARINFGGIHKFNIQQQTTKLKLIVEGFDSNAKKIKSTNGFIALLDENDEVAASWSFASLLKHWNTKHSNACYIPSLNRKIDDELKNCNQYYYGNKVILGSSTDFSFFLDQIESGNIYYDPGIKLELEITGMRKQNIKRRSQFRIKSGNLQQLYQKNELVDLDLF